MIWLPAVQVATPLTVTPPVIVMAVEAWQGVLAVMELLIVRFVGAADPKVKVASLALAVGDPPPDTLTVLVKGEPALLATFTVAVIAG